jgi:Tol biopolymer transport system component
MRWSLFRGSRQIAPLSRLAAACATATVVVLIAGSGATAGPQASRGELQRSVEDTDPTWSRQNVIAFLRRRGSDVWIVLRRPTRAETTLVKLPAGETMALTFSPDGTRLAVIANFRLYVVDVATGVLRRRGPAHEYDWAPDSRALVVNPYFEQTNPMRVGGVSNGRIIRTLVRGSSPDWSRGARAIAFSQARANDMSDIYLIAPGGGPARRLVRNAGLPTWSPSGRRIVFQKGAYAWMMDVRTRSMRRVAPGGWLTTWSAQSSHLALWDQGRRIRIVTPARPDRSLLRITGARPEWSPTGRHLAFDRFGFGATSPCDHAGIWLSRFPGGQAVRITGRC